MWCSGTSLHYVAKLRCQCHDISCHNRKQASPETSSTSPTPQDIGITENSVLMWAVFRALTQICREWILSWGIGCRRRVSVNYREAAEQDLLYGWAEAPRKEHERELPASLLNWINTCNWSAGLGWAHREKETSTSCLTLRQVTIKANDISGAPNHRHNNSSPFCSVL
jgi:hypothetical protein